MRRGSLSRRNFLFTAAAASTASAASTDSFTFVHITDTHIQPELHATEGCRSCFDRVNKLAPDFVIHGGDLVFDAAEVAPRRAREVYDLYTTTIRRIEAPVHTLVGNHDIFGVALSSGVQPGDPQYGKRIFEDKIGRRYSSFMHKGWQFITLDSIYLTNDRSFVGRIDDEQLAWLAGELAGIPKSRPMIVATHIPLVTGFPQYAESKAPLATLTVGNAREVLNLLWPYNLKAVLQGHTHVREIIKYSGCQFITSGAVCGNWWRGLRMGHPEGFGVLRVHNGEVEWRYETYGFHADPH